jgi:hypothetical protein
MPNSAGSLAEWWVSSKREVAKEFRKGFDSIILLVAWQAQQRVFDNTALPVLMNGSLWGATAGSLTTPRRRCSGWLTW